jgi:thiol-disulfide isomerase/thioredoxin
MKKIFLILTLIISVVTSQAQLTKNEKKIKPTNLVGSVLPFFQIQLTDTNKTTLKLDELDPNKTLVVMLFNPTCDHCIAQTRDFIANQASYGNTVFALITGDQMGPYMQLFYDSVGYKFQENIFIGLDIGMGSQDIFSYEGLPQILVYGKNRKLIDNFNKEQIPSIIKSAITRDNSNPATAEEMALYTSNRINIIMGTPLTNPAKPLSANHAFITKKYPIVPKFMPTREAAPTQNTNPTSETQEPKKGKRSKKRKK